ncbi:kelch-like protein 40a isoform X2 [Takifugu flavidus]|uniref:kelch-like protein 40a isoform X2 n=1 Tax=Takifugu flavidus TaxID=433684 RepID=UPI0025445063|nr:kelch-like protein 40a isoform X2 [Takifugu flavidus]
MAALTVDPEQQPRMYQQTLLQDGLCDLLETDKFVDCILKIKDQEFPCHRLVLAASSPFFKAMFLSDLEESKKREIVLRDVEPGVMGMILRYLYTSDIDLTEQNVQDIFIVANMYQIPSIFSVCVSYLQEKMVLGNCLAIFRLGLLLDCSRLVLAARDFICERYQVVSRDQDFLQLGPSELALIITSDALNVLQEELVFESLMDWVKHDEANRVRELPELLHCIRFRLIPLDYFKEKVERHQYLRFNQDIKKDLELVREAHKGRLPQPKKLGKGETEEGEEDEEGYLPGILNNNPRFGMFEMDLILMISDTGTVAYDPVGNECFVVSESTDIPKNHCSLVTGQNQVFVVGGMRYEENKDDPFSSYFLQFDPISSEWLGMPSQPNPRCLFGLTEAENSIFVVGGKELKEGEQALDSVMIYDRQSFKWGESDPLPYEVYGHGTVSHGGLVYVIGGKSQSKKCLRRVCVYNPTKFEWKDLAPLKTARSLFGVTVHNDQIYAVTGVTDSGLTGSVEVYDIAADRYDESERCWTGMLREISYAEGATVLAARLNILRLNKL